jgi:predicted kinase
MKSLSLSQPHMLIMVGIPGSGKSFFAEKFSETFHAPYVGYDQILNISGDDDELSAKYMTYLLHELFKTSHTIIVDGLANTRAQRAELKRVADAAGYKPLFIWVQTDEATAKSRKISMSKKNGHPIADYEYERLASEFTPPVAIERPVIVLSGKHTYATQAKVVLKNLAPPRRPPVEPIPPAPDRRIQPSNKRNITIR